MWEENDKKGFESSKQAFKGQINDGDFANRINEFAKDLNNTTFLEIGTWNGLGSTKQFVDELIMRHDDYEFYSLECNSEKCNSARNLYVNLDKVFVLNEVIYNEDPKNFYEIFPQCQTDVMFKKWHEVDMENMKRCKLFLERDNLPEIFDVVLLDGGEFTTYFDFQELKDKCKYLLLDDINVAKCTKIVEEIKSQPEKWEIIEENITIRNGFIICKNLNNI